LLTESVKKCQRSNGLVSPRGSRFSTGRRDISIERCPAHQEEDARDGEQASRPEDASGQPHIVRHDADEPSRKASVNGMTMVICSTANAGPDTLMRPVYTLECRQWLPRGLRETFEFFERPQNLPLITPPWLGLRILIPEPVVMARGLTIDYRVRVMGLPVRWRSLISEYNPPHGFRDLQVIGPYRRWDHQHRFRRENGGTVIEDVVAYEPPFGPLGALMHRLTIRTQLLDIFDFRARRVAQLLWTGTGGVSVSPDSRVQGVAEPIADRIVFLKTQRER